LMFSDSGGQKFTAQRIRKLDPICEWRAIRDTSTIPRTITTGVGFVPGPGGIAPHTHNLVVNENIISLVQVNQTTSVNPPVGQGAHNHPIVNGVIQTVLGHSHSINPALI